MLKAAVYRRNCFSKKIHPLGSMSMSWNSFKLGLLLGKILINTLVRRDT